MTSIIIPSAKTEIISITLIITIMATTQLLRNRKH